MCKKVLCVIVLLSSGVWAQAQQSQPGYAVLKSNSGAANSSGVVAAASPPEPAPLGGSGVPSSGLSMPGQSYPMAYPPGMTGPGMGGPGMPGMGMPGPGMVGPGMSYPPAGPGPMSGAPESYVPGSLGLDTGTVGPVSTFGTESFWVSLGYAAGWLTKPRLNYPLITESTQPGVTQAGAVGSPGTVVAFGDANYKYGTYHGIDLQLGVNITDQLSVEVSSQIFPTQHTSWTTASDGSGNPLIARPVFDEASQTPSRFLTSFPGSFAGASAVTSNSELWGLELAGRYKIEITPYLTGDFLLGYRRMELVEGLEIFDSITPLVPALSFLGTAVTPGTGVSLRDYDRFTTNNTFNGVDFGGRIRWQSGFDWLATTAYWKEALGATTETVNISGATSLITPAGTTTVPGGVLAQQSNGGNYTRSVFGSVTEGGVGVIITPCRYVRFEVGYSAMYWNSVVRPGNQINSSVLSSQVPTTVPPYTGNVPGAQPSFMFRQQSVTLQNLNVGLTFYY